MRETLGREVAEHLNRTPRQLPTHALYDALGSALFEAICCLPWYRVTRTEQALLARHAPEILERCGDVTTVAELGPGSGEKLLTLLTSWRVPSVGVTLIDVSADALMQSERTLAGRAGIQVERVQDTYEGGLSRLRLRDSAGVPLVVFLGSNIGNFDAAGAGRLLGAVRLALPAGGAFLLGTDLVKPEPELLAAYDDPLGVTAAFNRNLLVRLNRELGATFALEDFAHRAVWNAEASRVEMHLVSRRTQEVHIPDFGVHLTLDAGETIWTESSCKYRLEEVGPLLARAGFEVTGQWAQDGFALTLARAQAS